LCLMIIPIDLKLRGINSARPSLPTRIQSHRTKQLNPVFASALDHQLSIDITGIGFVIFAIAQIYKAYSTKFREKLKTGEMSQRTENFAIRTGQIGLIARGTVFGIIGVFLVLAAMHAGEARGLSGALRALEQRSYGQWLLGIVAIGLVAYGFYMLVQARFRRIIM